MTRGKIKLEYITNYAERRASFKKRKKGILNKANELRTLCDIHACIIIHSAYEPEPTVWPSPLDAKQIISRFQELPKMEQTQRLFNQESYTIQRIQKSQQQAKKLQRMSRLTDMEILMHQCMAGLSSLQNVPLNYITEMGRLAEQKMQDIMVRMAELDKNGAMNLQMGGMLNLPLLNPSFEAGVGRENMPYGINYTATEGPSSSIPPLNAGIHGNDAHGPSFRNQVSFGNHNHLFSSAVDLFLD